jgi:hypothetical protein
MIAGLASAGSEVLHRRFSGKLVDRANRFNCGQPPADGAVVTVVYAMEGKENANCNIKPIATAGALRFVISHPR